MYAISKSETFKMIGFNKNGTQMILAFAPTLKKLLSEFGKEIARHESMGVHNILPTFTKIVAGTADGFLPVEILYISTISEVA